MLRKRLLVLAVLGLLLVAAAASGGCTLVVTPVLPYTGSAFHETSQPVDITFDRTRLGERRGTAESKAYFFYMVAKGDASVMAAARNGGLTQIDHVESEVLNILGLYVRYTTVVHGR